MSRIIHYQSRKKIMKEKILDGHQLQEFLAEVKNNYNPERTVQEAELLGQELFHILSNLSAPVPMVKLLEEMGFSLFVSNLPNKTLGNIFVNGTTRKLYNSNQVIFIDESATKPVFSRFILAHELGHYLMDYLGNPLYSDTNLLYQMGYTKNNDISHNLVELRANRFAASLLMPKDLFIEQYWKAYNFSNGKIAYIVSYLSKYFMVETRGVERRIEEIFSV